MEAMKLALIQAIQVEVPEELVCRVCEHQFTHLHRIDIRGVTTIHMCEHCVEEFQEDFRKREHIGVAHVFNDTGGLLFGQRQEPNHIPIDQEDVSGLYDTAMYYNDH
jgi:hypothetical protein